MRYLAFLKYLVLVNVCVYASPGQAGHAIIAPFGGGSFTRANTGAWALKYRILSTGVVNTASSGVQNVLVGGSGNWSLTTGTLGTQTINYAPTSVPFRLELYPSTSATTPFAVWFSQEVGSPAGPTLYPDPANPGDYVNANGDRFDPGGLPRTFTHSYIAESDPASPGVVRLWVALAQRGGVTFNTQSQSMFPGSANHTFTFGPYNEDFSIVASYTTPPADTDGDGIDDPLDPYPTDPENNGWGDDVNEDDDGDGVANWDDEFPTDPTRGVAGDAAGTSGSGSSGPGGAPPAKYTKTIELDNSTGTVAAKFFVAVMSVPSEEFGPLSVLSSQTITVEAGVKSPLTINSDEPFTVNITKELSSGVTLEGEPDITREVVANGVPSNHNTDGVDQGATTVIKSDGSTQVTPLDPTDPTTELEGLGDVKDLLSKVLDSIKSGFNRTNELLMGSPGGSDGAATTSGTGAVSAIASSATGLKNALSGLVGSLFAAPSGSSSLSFTIPTGTFGNISIDMESFASHLALFRSVVFWCLAVWFLSQVWAQLWIAVSK